MPVNIECFFLLIFLGGAVIELKDLVAANPSHQWSFLPKMITHLLAGRKCLEGGNTLSQELLEGPWQQNTAALISVRMQAVLVLGPQLIPKFLLLREAFAK